MKPLFVLSNPLSDVSAAPTDAGPLAPLEAALWTGFVVAVESSDFRAESATAIGPRFGHVTPPEVEFGLMFPAPIAKPNMPVAETAAMVSGSTVTDCAASAGVSFGEVMPPTTTEFPVNTVPEGVVP